MLTTTCFGQLLWPSSGSCSVYIQDKVYQVQSSPLRAVDTITSIPNSGIIFKRKIKNWLKSNMCIESLSSHIYFDQSTLQIEEGLSYSV